jgi:RNA polymerase sigma-70 factor (ECF subfamily)
VTNDARQAACQPDLAASAIETAFIEFQAELLGTLFYLVGNREDARDALQESFVKCWKHRGQVAEIKNLKAWIFRIALNTGRDIRQTAWRRKRQGLPSDEAVMISEQRGPQALAESHEQMGRLRTAITGLRAEEQEVFLLRQNGQMKYGEIAEAVGIPLGTVKTRMRLALSNLRQAMVDDSG